MKKISILGVTGSVGTQALDVIRFHRETMELVAASAFKNFEKMIEILEEFKPKYIVLEEDDAYNKFENYIKDNNKEVILLKGIDGLKK